MMKMSLLNLFDDEELFHNIKENLKDYLQPWQRKYAIFPAYHDLCMTYFYFVKAYKLDVDIEEMNQQLKHSIKNFTSLCEHHETKESKEIEKEEINRKNMERNLKSLYENHLKQIS